MMLWKAILPLIFLMGCLVPQDVEEQKNIESPPADIVDPAIGGSEMPLKLLSLRPAVLRVYNVQSIIKDRASIEAQEAFSNRFPQQLSSIGGYNYSKGILPVVQPTGKVVYNWVKVVYPICQDGDFRRSFSSAQDLPKDLSQAILGQNAGGEVASRFADIELSAVDLETQEVAESDDFTVLCVALFSSPQFLYSL